MKYFKESSGLVRNHIKKIHENLDGSDTSSIDLEPDSKFLDTNKNIVAVRVNQQTRDDDASLFMIMNPHLKIQTRP